MSLTRRDLLKFGATAAAAWTSGVRPVCLGAEQEPSERKIPIAMQLFSVRDLAAKDMSGTIEAVAKMGYQGVEFAGYHGRKAKELRKILDRNGLKCCGTHTAIDALTGDALKRTVEFNAILGNKFLIVPWLPPEYMNSLAVLMNTAKMLTGLAEKVKDAGIRVGYHSHGDDFKPLADRIPWEVIFNNAGPSVVMQLDVGNCLAGGGNPVAELQKFPHRAATIHLKEFGGPSGALIGEGKAPWKEIFALCETTGGTEWYIVEHDSARNSPLEDVKLCLNNLREMGK